MLVFGCMNHVDIASYRVFESLTRMDILTAKLILHAKDFNMYILYTPIVQCR